MVNSQMKILIVDDLRFNLDALCHILKPGDTPIATEQTGSDPSCYRIHVAKSGKAALKKVVEEKPDLILLDVVMPDMDGFEVLTELKKSKTTCDIPVIFITGLDSVTDEEKGFALGAVDYITKPFHDSLVRARVQTHLKIIEQMRTIEMLGLTDALTVLPNRRGFDNRLIEEWRRSIREQSPMSLLLIDIDHFKEFNDTYGHQQGDTAIQTVARILKSILKRPTDFAARWGGEEFAVILSNTDIHGALSVAEGIRANVETAVIPDNRDVFNEKVTVSIGAASVQPSENGTMHAFIALADKALYAAKEAGRNRVCC